MCFNNSVIHSFGHSTYDETQALEVLQGIDYLIDVRSHPTSKWNQWEYSQLTGWLGPHGIKYMWMPELGGWDTRHIPLIEQMESYGLDISPYTKGHFPKGRVAKRLDLELPAWTVAGFWDYQWFMTLPEFDDGINTLLSMKDESVAIMCGELLPWSCHRSMIADYLLHFHGEDVQHLQPKVQMHSVWKSRIDRYEPQALQLMKQNQD